MPLSNRTRIVWGIVTLLALILLVMGAVQAPADFFEAYLAAYVFWIGITLGCFIILMIYFLAGGPWGRAVQRILEAAAQTSPLMALLLVPLAFGLPTLYPWARPELVAADPLLQAKSAYLNLPFFLARTLLYIVVWNAFIYRAIRWSDMQDRNPAAYPAARVRRFGAVSLVVFGLTVTFAGVDYLMSLEPHWFSSIYSAMIASGGIVSGLAFTIFVLLLLRRREPLASHVTPQTSNDLGNLLMAVVMVWAYLAYSQFLIIWSGNLTEEISWYQVRLSGGWQFAALAAVLANFVLPFAALLFRDFKRNILLLGALGAWLVVGHAVDVFWLVKPAFKPGFYLNPLDVLAMVAIGAVWLAVFRWLLERRPLVARYDVQPATTAVPLRGGAAPTTSGTEQG